MKQIFYLFLLTAGVIFLLPDNTNAQYNLGIATSNWSGTNALYLNPANIADSREKFTIDIFSANAGIDNNLGSFTSITGLKNAVNSGNVNNLFSYTNNATFSLLAPYAEVRLPGFMWSINHKHSIALTNSVNAMNQFNNFDQSLFRTVGDPNYVVNGNVTTLTSKNFNYTAQLWTQTGLTYAGVLLDNDEHEIKVGATLRYLHGVGYVGLKGSNLDVVYKPNNDSVHVTNSDIEFASNILNTKNAVLNGGSSTGNLLSEVFNSGGGSGVGGDLGIVYDYMPEYARDKYDMDGLRDYSRNRYVLRFSASIMDIGSIAYGANNNSNAKVTGNGYITGQGLSDSVKDYESFRNYAVQHGFTADTSHQNTRVYMPTTLHLAVDYNVYRNFYLNATYISNLANRQDFGNSYYNQVTVTPRYDRQMLSIGVPITYSMLTNNIKVGVGIRYSGFFVGSDDMLALIARNQEGLNVYVGGFVPFYKLGPKHRSNIPDSTAPEPDMEHGGSVDTSDNCPDMPLLTTPVHSNTGKKAADVAPGNNNAAILKGNNGEIIVDEREAE